MKSIYVLLTSIEEETSISKDININIDGNLIWKETIEKKYRNKIIL